MTALMPRAEIHEVILTPFGGGDGRALIVGANEQDFIEAVLADTASPDAIRKLAARRGKRRGADHILELSQAVHRRFHLILLEAHCREPGAPRLDPRKLVGMGFVIRRRQRGAWQAWMRDGTKRLGWMPLVSADADPESDAHPVPVGAGSEIGAMLAARRGYRKSREEVHPLFVAPDDICKKAGKTIVYGLIPVASGEQVDVPGASDYQQLSESELATLRAHLSSYFKARPALALPSAGQTLHPKPSILQSEDGSLRALGIFLQQMLVELGALESNQAARELMAAFATIQLPLDDATTGGRRRTISAADFIRRAAPILIAGEPNNSAMKMPLRWPTIDSALGSKLTRLALACLSQRANAITPPAGKFDGDAQRYAVRPFVRVAGHDDCPNRLIWGASSEEFRILPWWDGDGPATKIALPGLNNIRRMKPNVSFQLPPELANLLQGDMKRLKDGEKSGGPQPELDIYWLCSFSIPIITLCAFIVLNIFLSLFDLIFSWLAFIKICIPIPRPK
jgi:hypothetical protein